VNPNFILLYYKLLFNDQFTQQLIQKMDFGADAKNFWYAGDYLSLRNPFNNMFNFYFKIYPIDKLKVVLI